MEDMLKTLWDECWTLYLDGVLCLSKLFTDHVRILWGVLKSLQWHGVKLRPEKYKLFHEEFIYFSWLVCTKGVRVDPKVLEQVQALKVTIGDMRKLLVFLSYYRSCYVQDFSWLAKLLYDLLQNQAHKVESKSPRLKPNGPQLPSQTLVNWT